VIKSVIRFKLRPDAADEADLAQEALAQWLAELRKLGADPRARGYSMIQLIETAHGFDCGNAVVGVYGHLMVQLIETAQAPDKIAEDSQVVYLEILSCKWYDEAAAAEFARKFFRARRARMRTSLRIEARHAGIGAAR